MLTDTQRLNLLEKHPADLAWHEDIERWGFVWSAGKGHHYRYLAKTLREAIDTIATSNDAPKL